MTVERIAMALLLKEYIEDILAKHDTWYSRLATQWETIVGSLHQRIRLEKVFDDTIVIGVYDSHWMQELYLLSPELCQRINDFMGEQRINHIRFMLVERREKIARKTFSKKKIFRPIVVPLTAQQSKALESISDTELRQALTDFWGRCAQFLER